MFQLTLALLLLAILAQSGAALLAARLFPLAGRHRMVWAAVTALLFALLAQAILPLELAINTGIFDFCGALIGLLVALLALASVIGLRGLLVESDRLRRQLNPSRD